MAILKGYLHHIPETCLLLGGDAAGANRHSWSCRDTQNGSSREGCGQTTGVSASTTDYFEEKEVREGERKAAWEGGQLREKWD